MEETKTGLINRTLIDTINECLAQRGQLVLLYVQLDEAGDANAELHKWLKQHNELIWLQVFGSDCYGLFLLQNTAASGFAFNGAAAPPLTEADLLIAAAKQALGEAAVHAVLGAVPLRIGAAEETEGELYRAIKELQWSAHLQLRDHGCSQPLRNVVQRLGNSSSRRRSTVPETAVSQIGTPATIGGLAAPIPSFPQEAEVSEIARLMGKDSSIHNVVIVDGERPVGLVMKEKLNQLLAGQYGMPLYWRRPIARIMDQDLLVVESKMSVEQASQLAMARDDAKLYDVVTVTQDGRLTGAVSIRAMLETVTSRRTEAARTANPLTGLPGNEGIQREITRMLEHGRPFSIVYADLDYFKWFNDTFGFRQGDELIRYTGELLQEPLRVSPSTYRFVGHIGGDDFIVLTDDPEAKLWCHGLLRRFDRGVKSFYGDTEVTQVSDRHGQLLEREGVTLSLSLMMWDGTVPATPESISTLAARLKKQAKKLPGSICVVETITTQQRREEVR